jgi:hypothetical protein
MNNDVALLAENNNFSIKCSNSSVQSDMFHILSNNDRGTMYFSPRQPTPGFNNDLFYTWSTQNNNIKKISLN